MNLVLKLISSLWFWADILLSISGGVVVWWGLKVEKAAEEKMPPSDARPDIYADIIEEIKREENRGWKILMAGIVIEVVAAFVISIISGLEIADLSNKTAIAEQDAASSKSQVANLSNDTVRLSINLEGAKSNNFELAKQVFGLTAQTEEANKNIEQIRGMMSTPEIAKKLNEAKTSLVEVNKSLEDVKNVLSNSNLLSLAALKQQSLKDKIIDFINSLDREIIPHLKNRQRSLGVAGDLDTTKLSELRDLVKKDGAWQYIQIEGDPGTPSSISMRSDGTMVATGIRFWVFPALVQKQ